MTLNDTAKQLAKALLDSNEQVFDADYNVTVGNEGTGETIIVLAIKTTPAKQLSAVKALTERYTASASGTPCPQCGGSGRV